MSRVLVTGASGFFGAALVPRLMGAQYTVTSLSRTPSPLGSGSDVEHVAVDLRDAAATRRALSPFRWDAVVHLAGPAPKSEQTWADSVDTVTAHVQAVLHLTAATPPGWSGRFVHASGMIAYGTPESLPVLEDHRRRPMHAYGLAKRLAEDVLLGSNLADRWILRLGGLFSERRKSGALFNFARAASAGEPLRVTTTSPPVPWEVLHVDDAAEAVMRSLSSPARDPGPLNVGYGEPIHIVEIAERFAKGAQRGSQVVLTGPSPPRFHADISKARRLLDWPPASLAERLDQLRESIGSAA
jgi:nucleoside-diphosphate-sugar epimerase